MTLTKFFYYYSMSDEYKEKLETLEVTLLILNYEINVIDDYVYFYKDKLHEFTICRVKNSYKIDFFSRRENFIKVNLSIEQIIDIITVHI